MPRLRTSCLLLALAAVLACEQEPVDPPVEPLEPIQRTGGLFWVVGQDIDGAVAAAEQWEPRGLILADTYAPALDGSPAAETLAAIIAAAPLTDTRLGLLLSGLGDAPPAALCFDASAPTSDPWMAARAEALADLLDQAPELQELTIGPAIGVAPWDVDCTCTPCDSTGFSGQAERLRAVFSLLQRPTVDRGREAVWFDELPSDTGEIPAVEAMAAAIDDQARGVRLRAAAARGTEHPWAAPNPDLTLSADRDVAASLDLIGSYLGPTAALLLFPDQLHDRFRSDRQRGVVGWYAQTTGADRVAWARPEEANLRFAARLYSDLAVAPETLVDEHVQQRYGLVLGLDPAIDLAAALRHTGRALATATHPLGIAVTDIAAGPHALPLTYEDPRIWADGWEEAWSDLMEPDLQALIDINQWGAEAVDLAEEARASFELAAELMTPTDAEDLRDRLHVLELGTRAWKLTIGADVTLRAYQANPGEELASWMRWDAAEIDALALEAETAEYNGDLGDTFPAVPDALRGIASQLRAVAGDGEATAQPFPTVTEVSWSFDGEQTLAYWTVRPEGVGWWERGGVGWPAAYDHTSAVGEEPATFWTGWTTGPQSGERVPFRACGQVGSLSVCSSQQVFWRP